jgi:hypothetical protein
MDLTGEIKRDISSTDLLLQDLQSSSLPDTDVVSTGVHGLWLTFEDQELENRFSALRSGSLESRWRFGQFAIVWLLLALYHEIPWSLKGIGNWSVGVAASMAPILTLGMGFALSYNPSGWRRWGTASVLLSAFTATAAVLGSAIWKFLKYPSSELCPIDGTNCPSFVVNQPNVAIYSLISVWTNMMTHLLFRARLSASAAVFLAFLVVELSTASTYAAAYYIGIMACVLVRCRRAAAAVAFARHD